MSFTRYPDLPAELRCQVRQFAIDERNARLRYADDELIERVVGRPPIAPLACVNKEWQSDVERNLFSGLDLIYHPHSDLVCLDAMVTHVRQPLVKYIHIRDKPFDRGGEYTREFDPEDKKAAEGHAIDRLFRILSEWEMPESRRAWLTVDLNMMRPPNSLTDELPVVPIIGSLRVTGIGLRTWTLSWILRVGRKLPSLTRLVVFRTGTAMPIDQVREFVNNISQTFPNLKSLKFRPGDKRAEKRINLLQHGDMGLYWTQLYQSMTRPMRELSYGLEKLNFDAYVDLQCFFAPFNSENYRVASFTGPTWPRLRHLYLSEWGWKRDKDYWERLQIAIGHAVGFMPELQELSVTSYENRPADYYYYAPCISLSRSFPVDCLKGDKSERLCLDLRMYGSPSSDLLKIWANSVWKAQRRILELDISCFSSNVRTREIAREA